MPNQKEIPYNSGHFSASSSINNGETMDFTTDVGAELIGSNYRYSTLSAFWEFSIDKKPVLQMADKDNILWITRQINGGTNGLAERKAILNKAKNVLGIK